MKFLQRNGQSSVGGEVKLNFGFSHTIPTFALPVSIGIKIVILWQQQQICALASSLK